MHYGSNFAVICHCRIQFVNSNNTVGIRLKTPNSDGCIHLSLCLTLCLIGSSLDIDTLLKNVFGVSLKT